MQKKKVPLRRCVGCCEIKNKKELLRVVKNQNGEVSIDLTGKKAGRGAYICKNIVCFKKARKNRGLERALSCRISDAVYDFMEKEILSDG